MIFMVDSSWFRSLYQWYIGLHKVKVRLGMKYWAYTFTGFIFISSKAINHTTNNNNMISNNNKKCELSLCRFLDSVLVHLPFGPSCLSDVNIIRCRRKKTPNIVEVDLWNVCALSTWSADVHDWFMLIPKSLTVTSRTSQIQSHIGSEKNFNERLPSLALFLCLTTLSHK